MNPNWEGEAFHKKVVNDLGCNVNKSVWYRATYWIARRYIDEIRMNPNWEAGAFHKKVVNDLGCNVNKSVWYRAKNIALKVINGTHEESFAQIWDYGNEVKRVMHDTTLAIELKDPKPGQERGKFKRIYSCLGPVNRGFKGINIRY